VTARMRLSTTYRMNYGSAQWWLLKKHYASGRSLFEVFRVPAKVSFLRESEAAHGDGTRNAAAVPQLRQTAPRGRIPPLLKPTTAFTLEACHLFPV